MTPFLHYAFEPGDELDGVAVLCPSDQLNQIPEGATDWLVPGRLEEKVGALLRTLPKNLRVRIQPIDQTARTFSHTFKRVGMEPLINEKGSKKGQPMNLESSNISTFRPLKGKRGRYSYDQPEN